MATARRRTGINKRRANKRASVKSTGFINAQTKRIRGGMVPKRRSRAATTMKSATAGFGNARTRGGQTRLAVARFRGSAKKYGDARPTSAGLVRSPIKTRAQSVRSAKVASGGRRKGRSITARSVGSAFNRLHPRASNGRFRSK